jgi:NAD(P)H-binding
VTVALLDAGFVVTALSRKPDEARRVLPAATQIVAADARDEASLKRGLSGQDALYLNLSIAPTERRDDFHTEEQGLEHILSAARSASIKRIGYVSAMIHDDRLVAQSKLLDRALAVRSLGQGERARNLPAEVAPPSCVRCSAIPRRSRRRERGATSASRRPRSRSSHGRSPRSFGGELCSSPGNAAPPSGKHYLVLELTGASANAPSRLAAILYGSMKAPLQCCGLPFKWYSNSS